MNMSQHDIANNRSVPMSSIKKVSLSSKNKKQPQPTNEAVLNFISDNTCKKNANNSTMTGSSTLTNNTEHQRGIDPNKNQVFQTPVTPVQKKTEKAEKMEKMEKTEKTEKTEKKTKDVSKTLQFLKETHPEDREHLDIIS